MPTPKLQSLTPNLIVHDVNKTLDFYTTKLGFTTVATVPENGTFNWGMASRDGVTRSCSNPFTAYRRICPSST